MKTKYIKIEKHSDMLKIDEAASAIKNGGLVVFPTETVYGLGADALNKAAVDKIFKAKGRVSDNPLIVHISDEKMLGSLVKSVNDIERLLIKSFWPGPLTIIFDKKEIVPDNVTARLNTVGVRMPNSIIAKRLIEKAGTPIAAPSANISGKPSGTKIEDIKEEFEDRVDFVIDGGSSDIGIESTVIKVDKLGVVNILRPGKVTTEDIQQLGLKVEINKFVLSHEKILENTTIESPGMKYRHYAPNTKCILVYSKKENTMINEINKIICENKAKDEKDHKQNNKCLVISKTKNMGKYKNADFVLNMGSSLKEISKNIFTILRQVDNYKVDLVIIEGVEKEGLGLAIMNRLIRACEYNIIEV